MIKVFLRLLAKLKKKRQKKKNEKLQKRYEAGRRKYRAENPFNEVKR